MKLVKFVLAALLAVVVSTASFAQMHNHSKMAPTKTEIIYVGGSCGMCKTRIEKVAKVVGVTKAEWDMNTQKLTLVYNPTKVKSDDIQKKIAVVGHDTEKFKASNNTYNNLPGCCQYNRKK